MPTEPLVLAAISIVFISLGFLLKWLWFDRKGKSWWEDFTGRDQEG